PGIAAAVAHPALANFEREAQRTIRDGNGVAVFRPVPERDVHRQLQSHAITIFPDPMNIEITRRLDPRFDRFTIYLKECLLAPARQTQVERKSYRLRSGN